MPKRTLSLVAACTLAVLSTAPAVRSQTTSSAAPPPAPAAPPAQGTQIARSSASPAAQLGVYVFPAKSQSGEQQQLDQLHCYDWAKNQTHLDPLGSATSPTVVVNNPPPASAPPPTGHTAARGAAGGALFGAIAGNAGAGAAIGAGVGAIRGSRQNQAAQEQQAAHQQAVADAQQQANEQAAAQRYQFNKAFGACLDGKGYTVK